MGYGKPPVERQFGQPEGNIPSRTGRPKGSSILAPLLRKLAANQNEHGEGEEAAALAEHAIQGAKRGMDISATLKLMDRTDPEVKESKVTVLGDSGWVPMGEEGEETP